MNNLNSVLIEGYLVGEPKRTDFPNNKNVLCNFRIANNRFYKKGGEQVQETSYFNVDVWGNVAENCARYLKKGSGVRVVGRIKEERWKDAEEKNHYAVKIIAEHVDFLSKSGNATQKKATGDAATKTAMHAEAAGIDKEIINL